MIHSIYPYQRDMTSIKFIFKYNDQSLNPMSEKICDGNYILFYFNDDVKLDIFVYIKNISYG